MFQPGVKSACRRRWNVQASGYEVCFNKRTAGRNREPPDGEWSVHAPSLGSIRLALSGGSGRGARHPARGGRPHSARSQRGDNAALLATLMTSDQKGPTVRFADLKTGCAFFMIIPPHYPPIPPLTPTDTIPHSPSH